jgi:putative peptidoglycan lipid II flippase
MVGKILTKGKNIFTAPQSSILSAAFVIMFLVIFSQIFGVARQWVLLRYLGKEGYGLYLAAFRLPDLVFEIFAFGAFSSAFIPVFTKHLRKSDKDAWEIAGRVINIAMIIFLGFALLFGVFSFQFYSVVAAGFDQEQTRVVSQLARVLFAAQGFFIVSYVITGVLESLRRFLVPALAPLFYNIGIILGAIILFAHIGLFAPAVGAVLGALAHLMIQLPLAYKLGFRFSGHIKPTPGVKEIGVLALPRLVELMFLQVLKTAELFFSSLLSIASYTYLNLAASLQVVPVTLFGVSLAKAAMVSLSHQDSPEQFKKTFMMTLSQMLFFVIPASVFLIVLRVPVVRLIYGTSQSLDWIGTVQTGLVLTAFAVGIPFQATLAILSRSFYALHDTKTPVLLSIIDVFVTLALELVFIFIFHLPIWSLALANTVSMFWQVSVLFYLLSKKLGGSRLFTFRPVIKICLSSAIAGGTMFFLLKFFDRWVWVKQLSFLNDPQGTILRFQAFVLDTRYTLNLLILTVIVSFVGISVYILLSALLHSQELTSVTNILKRKLLLLPQKDTELVTQSTQSDV